MPNIQLCFEIKLTVIGDHFDLVSNDAIYRYLHIHVYEESKCFLFTHTCCRMLSGWINHCYLALEGLVGEGGDWEMSWPMYIHQLLYTVHLWQSLWQMYFNMIVWYSFGNIVILWQGKDLTNVCMDTGWNFGN